LLIFAKPPAEDRPVASSAAISYKCGMLKPRTIFFSLALVLALPAQIWADLATVDFKWDLHTVPFSRAGSYLAIGALPKAGERPAGLFLRSVRANTNHASIFVIEMLEDGKLVPFERLPSPSVLRLKTKNGNAAIVFSDPNTIRIQSTNATLRLRMWTVPPVNSAYPGEGNRWVINNSPNGVKLMVSPLLGTVLVDAPWATNRSTRIAIDIVPPGNGTAEVAIEEYQSVWHKRSYPGTFAESVSNVESEWQAFLARMPLSPSEYQSARGLASYLMWSSIVAASGNFKRPGMFMSKNNMIGVWSWDHCFNAMALAPGNPEAAWDQFMIMFDFQDENGGLPDRVNDRMLTWAHNKPPIHGWALGHMMKRNKWFNNRKRLMQVYVPLQRWTNWWFRFRDDDHDGLPQYNHGNDSGWDNATPFDLGVPLESPDLSSFLAIQMSVLSDIAKRIGKNDESRQWQRRSDALVTQMIKSFWRDDHFIAMRSGDTVDPILKGDSLFLFRPLLLGKALPESVRQKMLAGLRKPGRFLTDHGLATESPASPLYQPDGYWRGPIWAPSTMVLVEGIKAAGDPDLARDVSRKFCEMARESTMPENFDALTGKELRDQGYTWTSAVFLLLANDLLSP
jgi:putative isomerase